MRGNSNERRVAVIRKILAQLQNLLQIVEKKSTAFDLNRKTLEGIQKTLEEIRESINKQEEKLTSYIRLVWSGIEETAVCLKNLEEMRDEDGSNSDDVYVPSYSRLDGVVREYQRKKSRRWKKLRATLEALDREREENIPYHPGRKWEVINFNFDSATESPNSSDIPHGHSERKKMKFRRVPQEESPESNDESETIEQRDVSEDDEQFAAFLEIEAERLLTSKHVQLVLKSSPQVQPKSPDIMIVDPPGEQPHQHLVLQELSLNAESEETTRTIDSPSDVEFVPPEHPVIMPTDINNMQEYSGTMAENFESMGLNESLLVGVNLWGIITPTVIQRKAIPVCLSGLDMIVHAPTGQGKTTMAAISALNSFAANIKKPQVIFLMPSQEAAELAMRSLGDFGTFLDCKSACCKNPEGKDDANIFLGTPATTQNLISRRELCTDFVKMLIVDTVHEMNAEDQNLIVKVLYSLGGATQVILLTQELTQTVICISQKMRSPVYINDRIVVEEPEVNEVVALPPVPIIIEPEEIENEMPIPSRLNFENMNQFYVIVPNDELKINVLAALSETMEQEQAIIFCNTPQKADWLARKIRENEKGLEVCSVHGGRQNRDHLMSLFQAGVCRVLITTDFITRVNYKVQPIPLVLNYEFPDLPENYTRRLICAGRTVKDVKTPPGENPVLVFSFCTSENLPVLENLAKIHDFVITPMSSHQAQPTTTDCGLEEID